jgi:hypothetical protein
MSCPRSKKFDAYLELEGSVSVAAGETTEMTFDELFLEELDTDTEYHGTTTPVSIHGQREFRPLKVVYSVYSAANNFTFKLYSGKECGGSDNFGITESTKAGTSPSPAYDSVSDMHGKTFKISIENSGGTADTFYYYLRVYE